MLPDSKIRSHIEAWDNNLTSSIATKIGHYDLPFFSPSDLLTPSSKKLEETRDPGRVFDLTLSRVCRILTFLTGFKTEVMLFEALFLGRTDLAETLIWLHSCVIARLRNHTPAPVKRAKAFAYPLDVNGYPIALVNLVDLVNSYQPRQVTQISLSLILALLSLSTLWPSPRRTLLTIRSKGNPGTVMPHNLKESLSFLNALGLSQTAFSQRYNKNAKVVRWPLPSTAGPNGHATGTAHLDAIALKADKKVWDSFHTLAKMMKVSQWSVALDQAAKAFADCPRADGKPPIHSRLSEVVDNRGHKRLVALCDYWTNLLFTPLQETIYQFLNELPQDYSHRQDAMVALATKLSDDRIQMFSLDLQAATDKIPRVFYATMLGLLFSDLRIVFPFTSFWFNRTFESPLGPTKYGRGIPMGCKATFGLLSIFSHYAVRLAGSRCGYGWTFSNYAVCGDDILVYGPYAHLIYSELKKFLLSFGVPYNDMKSTMYERDPVVTLLSQHVYDGMSLSLFSGRLLTLIPSYASLGTVMYDIWSTRITGVLDSSLMCDILRILNPSAVPYYDLARFSPSRTNMANNTSLAHGLTNVEHGQVSNAALLGLSIFKLFSKWKPFSLPYILMIHHINQLIDNPNWVIYGQDKPASFLVDSWKLIMPGWKEGDPLPMHYERTHPAISLVLNQILPFMPSAKLIIHHPLIRGTMWEFVRLSKYMNLVMTDPALFLNVVFGEMYYGLREGALSAWKAASSLERPHALMGPFGQHLLSVKGVLDRCRPDTKLIFRPRYWASTLPYVLLWMPTHGLTVVIQRLPRSKVKVDKQVVANYVTFLRSGLTMGAISQGKGLGIPPPIDVELLSTPLSVEERRRYGLPLRKTVRFFSTIPSLGQGFLFGSHGYGSQRWS